MSEVESKGTIMKVSVEILEEDGKLSSIFKFSEGDKKINGKEPQLPITQELFVLAVYQKRLEDLNLQIDHYSSQPVLCEDLVQRLVKEKVAVQRAISLISSSAGLDSILKACLSKKWLDNLQRLMS